MKLSKRKKIKNLVGLWGRTSLQLLLTKLHMTTKSAVEKLFLGRKERAKRPKVAVLALEEEKIRVRKAKREWLSKKESKQDYVRGFLVK